MCCFQAIYHSIYCECRLFLLLNGTNTRTGTGLSVLPKKKEVAGGANFGPAIAAKVSEAGCSFVAKGHMERRYAYFGGVPLSNRFGVPTFAEEKSYASTAGTGGYVLVKAGWNCRQKTPGDTDMPRVTGT